MLSSKTATLSPKFNKDIEGRVKYYYFFLNLIKGNSSKFLVQKFNLISIFRNTFLADELYVQTVLSRFENFDDEYISSSRYIDQNRGKPYVFGHRDIAELKNVVNTKYAFARKIENPNIIK